MTARGKREAKRSASPLVNGKYFGSALKARHTRDISAFRFSLYKLIVIPFETGAACNQLSAFINHVNELINNGSLTSSQGQVLNNAANTLKTS